MDLNTCLLFPEVLGGFIWVFSWAVFFGVLVFLFGWFDWYFGLVCATVFAVVFVCLCLVGFLGFFFKKLYAHCKNTGDLEVKCITLLQSSHNFCNFRGRRSSGAQRKEGIKLITVL